MDCTKINSLSAQKQANQAAIGQPTIPHKQAIAVPQIGARNWIVRPIDLLHKIGAMTTPSDVNMAKLSASWATRRYFWTIGEPYGPTNRFYLSADARHLDFHQKTLLSDGFGIGFAGLLLESEFGACNYCDISKALGNPAAYEDMVQLGKAQPDYLMSSPQAGSPFYVVECKGSQSGRSVSYDQMRRGLEQVRSIQFQQGVRQVVTLVVATCMESDRTSVIVVDPPADDFDPPKDENKDRSGESERVEVGKWKIHDAEAFERRAWKIQGRSLLRWAGLFKEAALQDPDLEFWRTRDNIPEENLPQETVRTEIGIFSGVWTHAFPELGNERIRLFYGVEEELIARVREETNDTVEAGLAIQQQFREQILAHREASPYTSFSSNGTCMIIEGI